MPPLARLELPPIYAVLIGAAMWALARLMPIAMPDSGALDLIGMGLIAVGGSVMAWSALWFARKRTSIIPRQAPSAFIAQGPYRFSRNPIYLADLTMLIGWAAILGAASALIGPPVFAYVIRRRFIAQEEAALEAAFGTEYRAYKARVRRWL